MPALFDPIQIGPYTLTNRVFLAPLTRGRATILGTPTPRQATYYAQRASGGLLVTEATAISQQGYGWTRSPGIWSAAQVEAWKPVTAAVHAAGGRIFLQLWHMGRVSHPDFQGGALPVAPSAIAAPGQSHTPFGSKDYVTPRALDASELPGIVDDYVHAAKNAIAAGFDGVEIHGANGYLLDQFIKSQVNRRTDEYGGSIQARWRFPLQVAAAVAAAVGKERTGIRLSPVGTYNGMGDDDPVASFAHGAAELDRLGLAYVHAVEGIAGFQHNPDAPKVTPTIRERYSGVIIGNGGYDGETANAAIASGQLDAVAFGTTFLANPDLPARLKEGASLNPPDFQTFYAGDDKGYIDYPTMSPG